MAKCIILSGVPGSGKSTVARVLRAVLCSADDFFVNKDGEYNFDVTKLADAHGACLRKFVHAISSGQDVVVDNTNTTAEEIIPYYALASAWGYDISLVTVACDPEVAHARNTHGVSLEAVKAMAERIKNRKLPDFWQYNPKFKQHTY